VQEPDQARAQRFLDRARVELALGNATACRRAITDGLAVVRGSSTPAEVGLLIVDAQLTAWGADEAATMAVARSAAALAARVGAFRGRAEYVLAQALYVSNSKTCVRNFARARSFARSEGDLDGELEAWFAEAVTLSMFGDAPTAISLLKALRETSSSTKKPMWQSRAAWAEARTRWLAYGEIDGAIEAFRRLSKTRELGLNRPQVLAELALAHADRGEIGLARTALARSRVVGADDTQWSRSIDAYYRAEIDWAGGQLARGVKRIETDLDGELPKYIAMGARSTRSWFLFELGMPARDPALRAFAPFFTGAERENRAFGELARGNIERAEVELRAAARAWTGYIVRNELRAQWGAALLAVRQGKVERAREELLTMEERAAQLGLAPILARVRATLQLVTADLAGGRRARSTLTERQTEILHLVRQGNSSRQIAVALGLSPRTVDVHIRSAMERLGAKTRLEAATLAAGPAQPRPAAAPVGNRLLDLLIQGRTVTEAAAALGMSRRTANRRLAELRAELGVATTIEATAVAHFQ
jgi:DNA-binding CsgD family transcriptional regulator